MTRLRLPDRALGQELAHFLRRIDGGAGLELALDVHLEVDAEATVWPRTSSMTWA